MQYFYEILIAEPKHKSLSVRYFKDEDSDTNYFKNFVVEDWADETAITSVIHGYAPFVLEYWAYQDLASDVSPIAVGHIGSDDATPFAQPVLQEPSLSEQHRMKRNVLLAETDWMVLSDVPAASQAVLDYRQALRDITNQEGFPENVVWPVKPE